MIKSIAALTAALLLTTAAFADTYFTEFLGSAAGDFAVNRIEITWSTAVAFNDNVTNGDLSDLRISAYGDNGVLIFTDDVIAGSAVQFIGGVARDFDDIAFNAVSGVSVVSFDNDVHANQQGATGSTYNIYPWVYGTVRLDYFINGTLVSNSTFTLASQNTSAIPEPSTYAGITGLLGLGLAVGLRKRKPPTQSSIAS